MGGNSRRQTRWTLEFSAACWPPPTGKYAALESIGCSVQGQLSRPDVCEG